VRAASARARSRRSHDSAVVARPPSRKLPFARQRRRGTTATRWRNPRLRNSLGPPAASLERKGSARRARAENF
jgi:hypothetical protein